MVDYSRDEAEEILRRALSREQTDGVSHEDLVAAAAEVGIEAAEVERAAVELADERRRAERADIVRDELRRNFVQQLSNTLALNALVLGVDLLTGPEFFVQWVALVTGILLMVRAVRTFAPSEDTLRRTEKRIDKRERKQQAREQARDRVRSEKKRHGNAERQFERIVDEGVEALLRGAGDRLERYNREQGSPRVRVQEPDDHEHAGAGADSNEGRAGRRGWRDWRS